MDLRRVLTVLIVVGAGWWLWSHRDKSSSPAPSSSSSSSSSAPSGAASNGLDCVNAAEGANRQIHDAAMLAGRPPVDAAAWSSAESAVSSAISAAESACGSPHTEGDRKAAEEVKAALDLMRSSLSSLSSAARGQGAGGSTVLQNQEQIDAHLDRARAALR